MRFIPAALLLPLLLLATCRPADIPPAEACNEPYIDNPAHPLRNVMPGIMDKYIKKGLPGTVVYVRDANGVYVGYAGYSDVGQQIPMRPCVVSKVASITKMLVGTLTMKLWMEGKIDLDKRAAEYIDADIVKNVVNLDKATIRQLMNHTAGIPSPTAQSSFYLAVLNNPDKRWKAEEIIKYVYGVPEDRCCGADRASYSDGHTLLLSLVLDKILGYHHSKALQEMVLDPLGMRSTYYFPNKELPKYTARGYFDLYNNGTITDVTNINTGSGNGYGGIYSNVFDIATYLDAVWRNGQLLNEGARAEMLQFVAEDVNKDNPADTLYLGAGIMKRFIYIKPGSYGIGHTGRDLGYNATGFYFPKEDVTLMFLVNYGTNGNSSLKSVFMEYQDEILKAILKP
jgi:D-alanyl-D-alanine carboxypeptidase